MRRIIDIYTNVVHQRGIFRAMGKTYRRGGSERGYSSPGKSLRDKRQRGTNRSEYRDDKNNNYQSNQTTKSYTEEEKWT